MNERQLRAAMSASDRHDKSFLQKSSTRQRKSPKESFLRVTR